MTNTQARPGDIIRVIGSADGGTAVNGSGRKIIKSFTMTVDSVRGEISGTELRKDGQPVMRAGFIVTRTVQTTSDDSAYEIIGRETDTATVTTRVVNGITLYTAVCDHGHDTGLYANENDATAVALGHGTVSIPTYVRPAVAANELVESVEPGTVESVRDLAYLRKLDGEIEAPSSEIVKAFLDGDLEVSEIGAYVTSVRFQAANGKHKPSQRNARRRISRKRR